MRLKGYRHFDRIYKEGRRYQGSILLLRVLNSMTTSSYKQNGGNTGTCKCAVAISNKVSKKAVFRNRLRRLIHNHLQKRLSTLKSHESLMALLTLKPNSASKEDYLILNECDSLLKKAGLI